MGGQRKYAQEREHHWKRRGILNTDGTRVSHEQYLAMLEAQRHKCAICSTPINGNSHLDHNHQTGTPRGVLCQRCNMALGWLEPHLDAALAYLQLATGEEEDCSTWEFQFHFPVQGRTPWESLEHVSGGECRECGRWSPQLTENGSCEGCVMQAMIEQRTQFE